MRDLDDLALALPCPYCGARPGYWCVTARPQTRPAGQRATWLHGRRSALLREAWRIGADLGQEMEARTILHQLEGAAAGYYYARHAPVVPPPWIGPLLSWLHARLPAEDSR